MCFWKVFPLILTHVIHKIQCFEEFLHYFALFFLKKKKLSFPEFRPIEIAIKNVCESLSILIGARLVLDQSKHFRPIESIFRSIENRVENFLKIDLHVFKLTLSKVFQLFLSLYNSVKAPIRFFCHFPPYILQGFSLPRPVRPLYPSFCIYFHFSCMKSCIIWEISNLWNFWGFLIKPFLFQLINGFLLGDVINMIYGV